MWTLNADDRTISRIDPATRTQRTFGIGAPPTDLAAGEGALWVGNGGRVTGAQFAGSAATSLARLDPRTAALRSSTLLPRAGRVVSNAARQHIAFTSGAVWAVGPDASVVRISPESNRVVATVRGMNAVALSAAGDRLWALEEAARLVRIDPGRNRVAARVRVPAAGLTSVAAGAGGVWATDPFSGLVWRVQMGAPPLQRSIDAGQGVDAVAVGGGRVWVSNGARGTLISIDPRTNRIEHTIALGGVPTAVAVRGREVWVAVAAGAAAPAVRAAPGEAHALTSSTCGDVVAGTAAPDLLVVSDLPLQGGPRFPTLQMSAAVLDVLRRHRFRAGRFTLGYQSCDDSTARTGLFDDAKCLANAKAYAANRAVVGVIGPFNSGCAFALVPVASRAGLAIVSPTASDPGLTHAAYGQPPGALDALYPRGRRSFARVLAPDDAQGAALALVARRSGARRPVLIDDGGFGRAFSAYARRALGRLGTPARAWLHWDPRRPSSFERLARRAARARPDAIVLCGLLDTGAGPVLKEVRRALGRRTPVVGCEGLLPASLLFDQAGRAARGVQVLRSGLGLERLPRAGQAFVDRFGAAQARGRIDPAAVYAAQATEALVGAIARSDGSRESVRHQLLPSRTTSGVLGSMALDARGDPDPAPVTVYRLVHRANDAAMASTAGAIATTVIDPPARLWKP